VPASAYDDNRHVNASLEQNQASDRLILYQSWVPQVRRVFVFAPNLGEHQSQLEQIHAVKDLAENRRDESTKLH
jgi:hypothetical protein